MFSFKANLEMKRHQFSFKLISFAKWKLIPVNDPRATILSSFVFATLVYGVIGYKFCWYAFKAKLPWVESLALPSVGPGDFKAF